MPDIHRGRRVMYGTMCDLLWATYAVMDLQVFYRRIDVVYIQGRLYYGAFHGKNTGEF